MRRVVILGAGFGGLELASRLSEELANEVAVTLIDQNNSFVFGFSKLDVMFGREQPDAVRSYYRDISKPGVEFRQERVEAIDPVARHVVTDHGTYDADILVVALGANMDPPATPGFVEGGHDFYSVAGAERTRDVLAAFGGGNVVIGILGPFFKCPPAPFETAFMMHDQLIARGQRDASTITVVSPMPSPIPISPDSSAAIVTALAERDIEFVADTKIVRLDPDDHVAVFHNDRRLPYDLFLGIPVHRAPEVVVESGLTEDGWISVDPATFATRFPGVYAVGDVTSAPVPRAGVFAESEAGTVADVLIAQIGGGGDPAPYGGTVSCYLEFGGGLVAKVDVDFLSGEAPTGTFGPPSLENAEAKREFGSSRRRRWFGAAS